jgi:hypothetical protein
MAVLNHADMAFADPLDAFSIIYNSTEIPISKFKFALYALTGGIPLATFRLFLAGTQWERAVFPDHIVDDLLDLSIELEIVTWKRFSFKT